MESFQLQSLISLQTGTPLSYWFASKLNKGKTRDVVTALSSSRQIKASVHKSDCSLAAAYLVDQSLKNVSEISVTISWKFKKMWSWKALENQTHFSQIFIFTRKMIYYSKKVGSELGNIERPYDYVFLVL